MKSVLLLTNEEPDWVLLEREEAEADTLIFAEALRGEGRVVDILTLRGSDLRGGLIPYPPKDYIVFNWAEALPGVPNSEPDIPLALEELGYSYTGSSSCTLAISESKVFTKTALRALHIPTPPARVFLEAKADGWSIFPAIVKLCFGHGGVGISSASVVTSRRELECRVAYILKTFRQPALVEGYIDGPEFEVGIFGNGDGARLLPVQEIEFRGRQDIRERIQTYEGKFISSSAAYGSTHAIAPIFSPEQEALLERTLLAAYSGLRCRDYGRFDVRFAGGIFWVIDFNANPTLVKGTPLILAAEEAGYSYGGSLNEIVCLAEARQGD